MSKTDEEVIEKTIDLDEATAKEIAKHVTVDTAEIAKQVAEAMKPKEDEKKVEKKVGQSDDQTISIHKNKDIEKLTDEQRTRAHLKALRNNDGAMLREHNLFNAETQVKAGYLNVTTEADGGGFVPDAQLIDQVLSLEPNYGVMARLLRTVNISQGDTVKANTLTSTVEFTEVSTETGVKATTKPVFAWGEISLREFAGIAVMTDQMLDDAAIDIRGMLSTEFAKAAAKKEDQLGLTDATSGIANIAGTVLTSGGAALANIDFDDILTAKYSVPSAANEGATWVVSRQFVRQIQGIKDTTNRYILQPGVEGGVGATLWGDPFVVSELLSNDLTGVSKTYAVYGNWGEYGRLLRKAGLKLTYHDSGVVNVGGTDYNLIQQDMSALRAVIRRNVFYPLPGAFAVVKSNAA